MADITATTIATFAIRLNILVTLLKTGTYHLPSLTAGRRQTASPFGSQPVSDTTQNTPGNEKATSGKHPRCGLYSVSVQGENIYTRSSKDESATIVTRPRPVASAPVVIVATIIVAMIPTAVTAPSRAKKTSRNR
jgi:hypothetical protein